VWGDASRQKEMRQIEREKGKVDKTMWELEWNAIKEEQCTILHFLPIA